MPERFLPSRPNLEQYKKQAKDLARDASAGNSDALARFHRHHPRVRELAANVYKAALADAQLVLAREHGFDSWPKFAEEVERLATERMLEELNPADAFVEAAGVNRSGWHGAGDLKRAEVILARHPELRTANIYCAAVLGDADAVRAELARDDSQANAKGGPHGWDALTYLCFSRYLRIEQERGDSFVDAARVLLQAGANANTRWTEYIDTPPRPLHESVIYGAAGIAQNGGLTKLLLEFGADPNDEETPYHIAETYDNSVLTVLMESGRLNAQSLATIATRKCDWHDHKGLQLVLERGADPNYRTVWKITPLHQSIRRDNGLVMQQMLLDRGADPLLMNSIDGRNAFQMAAYHGRGDLLDEFARRRFAFEFIGMDGLIAACARGDVDGARAIVASSPHLLQELLAQGGTLMARYAGPGNDAGVRCLMALGVPVDATWPEGDGYWGLARGSTALHVATWRANHDLVRTLIDAGAQVNCRDARGGMPLQLAVKACVDSYWSYRRQPDSVAALLAAGAEIEGIDLPTGYAAIDELLSKPH